MISRNLARGMLSLIALVCLVAFALPNTASAKSPTAQTQTAQTQTMQQDYTIASAADNAGYQHIDAVINGVEVETDVGARASARQHSLIGTTPARGYSFAYGRVGTNERLTTTATSKNTLYGEAGRHLRRLSRC